MNPKINTILDEIKELTLLEAVGLVKEIEEAFGVDASSFAAPVVVAAAAPIVEKEAVEEQIAFDVILTETPKAESKMNVVKLIRSLTSLGMKEAKELADTAPKTIKQGVSKEESESIKKELEAAGAKVAIK